MKEFRVGSADVICTLTLLRKMFPPDLLVSHFDADLRAWIIDSCVCGFRIVDPSKRIAFARALDFILNRKEHQGRRGRPAIKDKAQSSYNSTAAIQRYLATIAGAAGVSKSAMVNYLIVKSHAAYRDKIAAEAPPEDDTADMTDAIAWAEALRERTIASDLEKAQRRDAFQEYTVQQEEIYSRIAKSIREDMSLDQEQRRRHEDKVKIRLLRAEARKEKQRGDD